MRANFNKILSATILGVTILSLSACDLFGKEAERTKKQLQGLAKEVGLDDAGDSLGKAYKENLAPALAPVEDLAVTAKKNAESIAAINSTVATVEEKADEFQRAAEQYSNQAERSMPTGQGDLVRTIDYYQAHFSNWLLSLNPNVGRKGDHKKK